MIPSPSTFRALYVPTGSPSPDLLLPLYSGHGVVIGAAGGDVSNAGLWHAHDHPGILGYADWAAGSPFVEGTSTRIHGDPAVGWFAGEIAPEQVVPMWLPRPADYGTALIHHREARGSATDLRTLRLLAQVNPWPVEAQLRQHDDGVEDGSDFAAHGDSGSFVYKIGEDGRIEYTGATRWVTGFGMSFLHGLVTSYATFGRVIAILDELGIPREELVQGSGRDNAEVLRFIEGRTDYTLGLWHLGENRRWNVRSIAMPETPVEPAPEPTPEPSEEETDMPTSPSRFNEPREGIAQLFDGDPKTKGLTFGDMELVWADGSLLQFIAGDAPASATKIVQLAGVDFTAEGIVLVAANDTQKFPWRSPERIVYIEPDGDVHAWNGDEVNTVAGARTVLPFDEFAEAPEDPSETPEEPLALEDRVSALEDALAVFEARLDLLEELS